MKYSWVILNMNFSFLIQITIQIIIKIIIFETNLDDFSVNLFLWKSIKFIHLTNINFCFLIKNCKQITVVIFILHLFLTALHYCSHILLANLGS